MDNYDSAYAKSLSASQKYEQLFAYCMEHEADPEAMADLSVCYFNGYGTGQDYDQCFYYDNKAAKLGSAKGKAGLAYDYLYGIGTEKNYEMALNLLEQSIAGKCPKAYRYLGVCYEDGIGVDKDEAKAVELYAKAAELDDRIAVRKLGLCYELGTGVEPDIDKAVELYAKAAELGDRIAMRYLGQSYENGDGVEENKSKAVELYAKAAELCDRVAIRFLGLCYEQGTGVDKDVVKATELYAKAADLGDSIAKRYLGVCYENGIGVEKDLEKATVLYAQASSAGDAEATRYLALCYDDGTGVVKCADKAVELYNLAITQGDDLSAYYLGISYEEGTGVEENIQKAIELYSQAADYGYVIAYYKLANCYKKGIGVEVNAEKAIYYFKTCSDYPRAFGDSEFADLWVKLAECYEEMNDTVSAEQAYKKAIELYTELATTDNGDADYHLGMIRKDGCRSVRDYTKAFQHFEKASIKDHVLATSRLARCYEYGEGVQQDKRKAFSLIRSLAEKCEGLFELELGVYYDYGIGTKKDTKKAIAIYEKYVDGANEDFAGIARFLLGVCYYHGEGTVCNKSKALQLFQSSNELLSTYYIRMMVEQRPEDFHTLDVIYRSVKHPFVKQNLSRAYEFCVQAYESSGKTRYIDDLANAYFAGKGTKRNLKKAFELYTMSNSETAKQYVGRFYYYGGVVIKNEDAAVKTFDYGTRNSNDSSAEVYLGLCYLNGIGIRQNTEDALKWFQCAAKKNDWYGMAFWSLVILSHMSLFDSQKYDGLEFFKRASDKNEIISTLYEIYQLNPAEKTAQKLLDFLQAKMSFRYEKHIALKKLQLAFKSTMWIISDKRKSRNKSISLNDLILLREALLQATADIEYKDALLSEKENSISLLTQEVTYYRNEVQNKLDVIGTHVDEVNSRTSDILEKIETVISKLDEEIKQQKTKMLGGYDMAQLSDEEAEEVESTRTDFINVMAEVISERLYKKGTTEVDVAEKQLKGMFGAYWDDLDEYTRKSLVSAKVFLSNCGQASYSGLDYSGMVISATSALENELKLRFHTGYQKYLKSRLQNNFSRWPESMKFRLKNGRYVNNEIFTLGSMPFIFGARVRKEKSKAGEFSRDVVEITPADRDMLNNYLHTILINPQDNIDIFLKEDNGVSFIDRCEDVRCIYRNKAAHTDTLSIETARDCYRDIIEVVDQDEAAHKTGQIQGLLYRLVRLTRCP